MVPGPAGKRAARDYNWKNNEMKLQPKNVKFCSVLYTSSIRGLATPWTYFLHLFLSADILMDSSTESLVHVLMLSIQAVRGFPRMRAPGIVPCIISFPRQLPCFLIVWP